MKSGLMPYSRTILDKIQSTPALCNNYFVHILTAFHMSDNKKFEARGGEW